MASATIAPPSPIETMRTNVKGWHLVLALAVIGLIAPQFLYPVFLMKVLCYALFACAYNLIFGYVGLLAFGHAAFYGTAAYVTGHAAKHWGLTPELAILTGVAAAAAVGFVIGSLAVRRTGLYFAMITFALAQIVYFYALQAPWTGGEDGLQGVSRGMLFGFIDLRDTWNMYLFVLAVFLAGFAIVYRAIHSPFGQVLTAIRENEARAASLGYDTARHKILAFVLSAALAGLAGGTKTIVFELATLTDVYYTTSSEVLLMVLMGGIGTVLGPVVGAVILVTMQLYLSHLASWVLLVQGSIFVIFVLVARKGIVGSAIAWMDDRRDAAREKQRKGS